MWLVLIPVFFILLFVVYSYVLAPAIKTRLAEKKQRLMAAYAAQLGGREDEARRECLRTSSHLAPIVAEMQGEAVLGIVSCQEKREVRDFVRQQALYMAGKAVGAMTGIGFKEVDNTEHYYLALTEGKLHYLHFSESGVCKQHLQFDRNRLEGLESGPVTAEDMLKHNAAIGEVTRLGFVSEDVLYRFFFYDGLWGHPLGKSRSDEDQEFAELNYLLAEPFKAFASRYRSPA